MGGLPVSPLLTLSRPGPRGPGPWPQGLAPAPGPGRPLAATHGLRSHGWRRHHRRPPPLPSPSSGPSRVELVPPPTPKVKYTGQMTPMYCGTLLMGKANNMVKLREMVKYIISQKMTRHKIVYELPKEAAANKAFAQQALEFLELDDTQPDISRLNWGVAGTAARDSAYAKRRAARAQLVEALPGNWLDLDDFIHFCPAGCCKNIEETHEKIHKLICEVLLDRRPKVGTGDVANTTVGGQNTISYLWAAVVDSCGCSESPPPPGVGGQWVVRHALAPAVVATFPVKRSRH